MIEIVVDNRIRIREDSLPADVAEALKEKFQRKNPMFWKLRSMGRRTWGVEPVSKCWRVEGDDLTFGRGAFGIVRELLVACLLKYKVIDRREPGKSAPVLTHFVEERNYQSAQIALAIEKQNCILRASTGAGKTTIGLGIAAAVGTHTLILVDSEGIGSEWLRRCEKELNITAGFYGKGKKKLGQITVALHQTVNLMKPSEFETFARTFGCVICDEVQILGAKTYGRNVDRLPSKYRIGLSDDHHRVDGQTYLVTDLMGPVVSKVGDKQLLAERAIAPLEVYVDPLDFRAQWYTDRALDADGKPMKPTGEDFTRLVNEMALDDARTARVVTRIAERIALGKSFLVFSHRVEHCQTISRMLTAIGVPSGLMIGGTDDFEKTRDGLLSGLVKAGVGTLSSLGKGINVPSLDGGYATTPVVTSSQTWRQATGRVKRPKGERAAEFWVAWDRYVFGRAPIDKLEKWHRGAVKIALGDEFLTPREYSAKGENEDDRQEDSPKD